MGFVSVLALSVWVSVVPTIVPLGAVTAVNAEVPLPFKMPVNVAAPDPPLATFSTGPASNTAATANTGCGGGGGFGSNVAGKNGGSGYVLVRWLS